MNQIFAYVVVHMTEKSTILGLAGTLAGIYATELPAAPRAALIGLAVVSTLVPETWTRKQLAAKE